MKLSKYNLIIVLMFYTIITSKTQFLKRFLRLANPMGLRMSVIPPGQQIMPVPDQSIIIEDPSANEILDVGENSHTEMSIVVHRPTPLIRPRSRLISTNPKDVRFYLYPDPSNSNYTEEIIIGDEHSLHNSHFNQKLPVILILHGFLSNYSIPNREVQTLKNAYLRANYEANIVAVDYGRLATPNIRQSITSFLFYFVVIRTLPIVGHRMSDFVLFLMDEGAILGPGDVQIVGFSLGAHAAGVAGQDIFRKTGVKLNRISGLEPAGPFYYLQAYYRKLDVADAAFVDVTHTDQGYFGYRGKLGHVDFLVNGGGPGQPGCFNFTNPLQSFVSGCSHARGFQDFALAIEYPKYFGCRCNFTSCQRPDRPELCQDAVMYGQYTDQSTRGNFYVTM